MKLVISFTLLFVGSILALVLNWARMGSSENQAWSLLKPCPICFDVSKLLAPVMAVDLASKVALYMVAFSFSLSLLAMALVLLNKPKSLVEIVLGLGGVILALAPLMFSTSVPEQFPIQLESASYAAMLLGSMTFVGAFASMLSTTRPEEDDAQQDLRDGWADAVEEGKRIVRRVSSTYGSTPSQ